MAPHNLCIRFPGRVSLGDVVPCTVIYGHYFEPDGSVAPERLTVRLAAPDRDLAVLNPEAAEDGLKVSFPAGGPGVHAVLADYDNGVWSITSEGKFLRGDAAAHSGADIARVVHYVKFAKALVVSGEAGTWPGSFGMELELVLLSLEDGAAEILVQHRGQPLAGARVFAQAEGRKISRVASAGEDGVVALNLAPGRWMAVVNHELQEEGGITRSLQAVLIVQIP